jgi:hypothetical protein
MDCGDCKVKDDHSGIKTKIDVLCRFREDMTQSNGTVDRLWQSIDKKVSKGMLVTFTIVVMGLVGTLFGLVYHSNMQLLRDVGAIKTDIAVIQKTISK